MVALAWAGSKPQRGLSVGLLIGAVTGLVWPITLWIAAGSLLRHRLSRSAGITDPARLHAEHEQALAFARQAELEGMPTSAAYWRAEAQRLDAQRQAAGPVASRPASTAIVVLGCTVGALLTFGVLGLAAPSPTTATEPTEPSGTCTYRVEGTAGMPFS